MLRWVRAACAMLVREICATPPLPQLNIEPAGVSVSGISSAGSFATQLGVAFSKSLRGIGIFAGMPYHCAVTHFPKDEVVNCNSNVTAPFRTGPAGCQSNLPCEPECPKGMGLLWDHCGGTTPEGAAVIQKNPDLVDVSVLREYAMAAAATQAIDPIEGLATLRSFLFVGTKDAYYMTGCMKRNAEFFRAFAADPQEQVLFHDHVPALHSIPTISTGTPCGTEGNYTPEAPHGLEACGYDGAGECLQHIYGSLKSPTLPNATSLRTFDQRALGLEDTSKATGFSAEGWIYLPARCEQGHLCRLHVFLSGCGMAFNSHQNWRQGTGFNLTYVKDAGFNAWAEANDIVILYPQKDSKVMSCWDAYGWQGPDYATKKGEQMAAIWNVISHLAGLPQEPLGQYV